ncbi:MAG: hypothetical protein JWL65_3176 [Gammaproteobacteria bacterium]|nr:hypothetical protein [Gammaproteobacteria bacterium]
MSRLTIGMVLALLVQTLACGIERLTDMATDHPRSQLVHVFPGSNCGVPTIVGHYLIQSVPTTHGLIVLDLSNPSKPVEVSRLKIDDVFVPHWTGWDTKALRLAVTGYGDEHRLFMSKLDQLIHPDNVRSLRVAHPGAVVKIVSGHW